LIDAARTLTDRTMFVVLYSTGMRNAEMRTLHVKDIDSRSMLIHLQRGKGGRDGYVPLSQTLLETLRMYWRWMKPKTWTRSLSALQLMRGNPMRTKMSLGLAVLVTGAVLSAQVPDTLVRPKSGWLYVAASDYRAQVGRVLLVDPDAGRVVGILTTGVQPDIAVSSDRTRLSMANCN
jgi:hypothetical protein